VDDTARVLAARDYGYIFGKIMAKHPDLDAVLVNDILRTTIQAMVELAEKENV
jgi:hypothetical protein